MRPTPLFCALSLALTLLASPAFAQVATPDPFVERLEPTAGPPGTVVTLVGRHFRTDQVVSLAGVVMEVRERRPNRWTVVIPEGATSGHVLIRLADGTTISGPELRVMPPPPAPTITSVTPSPTTPGSEVHIVGTGFSSRMADDTVTMNGVSLVVHSASPTELVVVLPRDATTGPLVVRVASAGEVTSAPITIESGLTITALAPTTVAPGMELTITGTGFDARANRNRVTIGGVSARVRTATATSLVVTVPEHALSGAVVVEPRGAGTVSSATTLTVRDMPTITTIDPSSATPGASIRIRGTGFGSDIRVASVSLGGVAMTLRGITDTEITVDVPTGAGTGHVSVTVAGLPAVESRTTLSVLVPVALTSFSPLSGGVGSEVTIVGVGFSATATEDHVTLAGVACPVISASPTELRIRIPATTSGPLVVEVTSNGTARTPQPFVITTPPTITSFEPALGAPGTSVTITGTNFGTNAALVDVTVGGVRMDVRSVTATTIVANVPAAALTGALVVTVRLQGAATSSGTFRVLGPFTVTATTALSGYPSQTVTIRGTGFTAATTVRFSGTTANATSTFVGPTELRATIPEGATAGPVTVRSDDGREASVALTLAADPEGPIGIAETLPTCAGRTCTVIVHGWGFGTTARAVTATVHGRRARVRSVSAHFLELTVPSGAGTGVVHVEIRGGATIESAEFAIE